MKNSFTILILVLVIISSYQVTANVFINESLNITENQEDINQTPTLYSPERTSVAAPALLSLIIGFIGVLVIIIYLLSIILNRKIKG